MHSRFASHPQSSAISRSRFLHRRNPRSGLSLVEVVFGMAILAMVSMGILAALMQSRRLTEGSIRQNTAVTAAQGYIEQMKNMEFDELALNPIPCRLNETTSDPVSVSPQSGTPVVNHRFLDVNTTPGKTSDDMPLDVIVYVKDITNPANGIGESKAITINYTWLVREGAATRSFTNTVSCIRSKVPTP